MRVLALDVGSVRIGVAVSDETGIIAQPLKYIDMAGGEGSPLHDIKALIADYDVKTVVVGLPLSMSGGSRGLSSRRALALGAAIEKKIGCNVVYFDERFSTAAARRLLIEDNVRRNKRKQVVDKLAAAVILQGYLDGQK